MSYPGLLKGCSLTYPTSVSPKWCENFQANHMEKPQQESHPYQHPDVPLQGLDRPVNNSCLASWHLIVSIWESTRETNLQDHEN